MVVPGGPAPPARASAAFSRRTITRTASHSRLLSLGSCISAAVTVLSSRTTLPDSILVAPGAGKQRPIDRLPCLGPDRADRLVQDRLLRGPANRHPGEGAERRGVLKMERQLVVAQLPMLLQERAAQHRLHRQAAPTRLLDAVTAQVLPRPGRAAPDARPATPTSPSVRGRSRGRRKHRIDWPGRCVPDALSAPAVSGLRLESVA